MKVVKTEEGQGLIIPEGKIDVTNSHHFKARLAELFDEGVNEITVDFTNVDALDSSGIGKLLVFYKKLKDRGGSLSIINVKHKNIQHLLDMIRLDKVINIDWD